MVGMRNNDVSEGDDLYACLGCSRSAYQADLRRAFRLWGLRCHPAKGGDRHTFSRICNAWEVLGNEDLKDKYDRYGLASLAWDGGFSFTNPDTVFNSFFKRFGGYSVAAEFLKVQNGAGWEGWQSPFDRLCSEMPALQKGMSCCGEFEPAGSVTPMVRTASKTVYSGGDDAGSSMSSYAFATPAPGSLSSYSSFSSVGSLPRSDSMKGKFLEEFRKKSGTLPEGEPNMHRVDSMSSVGSVSYYGMPCKEAALEKYRSSVSSSASGSSRRPSLYELRDEQAGDQQLRSKWIESFRSKLSSRGESF